MEQVPCAGCSKFFTPRNKKQNYCSTDVCQKRRKALWQKQKVATDPEYKEGQHLSQEKWLQNNPDYWGKYRKKNKEKTDRNRQLQRIRNLKRRNKQPVSQSVKTIGIAKMDARNSGTGGLNGQYWLVPKIAKMDAVKIFITAIPGSYP